MFNLALAQYPINFYNSKEELTANLDSWFKNATENDCKLLVFPEYASMELVSLIPGQEKLSLSQQLEGVQGLHDHFLETFIYMSKKYRVYSLPPSFPIMLDKKIFNRAYIISPSGKYDFQDKIHMTRFEEGWGISSSKTDLKLFETSLGNIAIQICFDIEFPWASSILSTAGAELILAPSCTEGLQGLNRVHIGARARALEGQLYVGVSQVIGDAPWSHAVDKNVGIAAIYSPVDLGFSNDGLIVAGALNESKWIVGCIDTEKLKKVRSEGQVQNFVKNSEYPWNASKILNLNLKKIELK